ncbi:hypothetical protein ACIQF8_17040 [Pseudarthrobacter sp. NPDC092184]|uniref:hypothetical protein n=1 Tax=unclassified Pseudarthrobacter TaxID=2647000 RepID=UPI0037F86AED
MKLLKYALGFLDQGILSFASLLFLILAAQFGSSDDLGSFVLGLSTAVLIQSLVRAVSGETLLVRSTRADFGADEVNISLGLSVVASSAVALTLIFVGLLVPSSSYYFFAVACAQFGLLLQDGIRFAALARGSTYGLLATDGFYAAATCSAIYIAGQLGRGSSGMLVALGVAATLASVIGCIAFHVIPRFRGCFEWLRTHWRLNSALVSEAILGATLGYSITLILNFVVSGAELAAYRSVLSIFGLTSLAINFLRTVVLRDLREGSLRRARSFWSKSFVLILLVFLTVAATYLVLINVPSHLGNELFGSTWTLMSLMFFAGAVNRIFAGISVVPTVFLRVQGITWGATTIRIVVTLVGFGLGPVGAVLAGAKGALLAEALAYFILTTALMTLSWRVARRGKHRLSPRKIDQRPSAAI